MIFFVDGNIANTASGRLLIVLFVVITVFCQKATADIEDGLVAYWSFDQCNAVDDSGNGYNGTMRGSPLCEEGVIGKALFLDPVNDYISFSGTLYGANPAADIRAFSFFLKSKGPNNRNGAEYVISKYNWHSRRSFLIWSYSGVSSKIGARFYARGDAYDSDSVLSYYEDPSSLDPDKYTIVNNTPFDINVWKHVVVNVTDTEIEIWVDGQITNKVKRDYQQYYHSGETVYIGNAFNIGPDFNFNYRLNGSLDEFRIFNRPLDPAEIQTLALRQLSIHPAQGGDIGNVTVNVYGHGFAEQAAVSLVRDGEPPISGGSVDVKSSNWLTTTFDLKGKALGLWDLVILNPDGSTFSLEDGFTVEEGRGAKLWTEIVGPSFVRVGRPSTQVVVYGNSGNVDARYPWLEIGLPSNVPHEVDVPPALIPITEFNEGSSDNLTITVIDLPVIPPGETGIIRLTITPRTQGKTIIKTVIEPNAAMFLEAMTAVQDTNPLNQQLGQVPLTFGDPTVDCPTDPCPEEWPISDPSAGPPPAGYICWWRWRDSEGNKSPGTYDVNGCEAQIPGNDHTAKSIGGGKVIELWDTSSLNCPGDPLRVNDLDSNNPHFKKCFKPGPWYDQAHAEEIVQKANAALELWGSGQATYTTSFCEAKATIDSLISDCMGFVHILDPELIPEDKTWFDKLFDKLSISGEDGLSPGPRGLRNQINERNRECRGRYEKFIRVGGKVLTAVASWDPNTKSGAIGYGLDGFVAGSHMLPYLITFENRDTATAPAQEVTITDQLDKDNMDLSTFSLGPIAFGETIITPPPGLSSYSTSVDLRPNNDLIVRVAANLDPNTGLLTWQFTSIDPDTGKLPEDPFAGFLPPNVDPPEGDGSVLFTVMPKEALPTTTVICNQANIVFDTNAPIVTPEWCNSLDNDKPDSAVLPFDPIQNSKDFMVKWSGTDEGAGITGYTILVSEDDSSYTEWLSNTSDMAAIFSGEHGRTYSFYSVATDGANNIEAPPEEPDAETVVAEIRRCDADADGDIDRADIRIISRARGEDASGPDDPRDFDDDGLITRRDVTRCSSLL